MVLIAIAWYESAWAVPLLTVLALAAIAGRVLGGGIGDLDEIDSAITTSALVGVAVGGTALGHRRTRVAGMLLLAVGMIPVLLGEQTVYMAPMIATGILYLLSDALGPKPGVTRAGKPRPSPIQRTA